MHISFLTRHPKCTTDVATMIYENFVRNSTSTMTYNDVVNFLLETNETCLPVTLVAIEGKL